MAVTYFVATTGSDNNGGSSEGAAKASGTGAATTAAVATVSLVADLPNLSTVVIGDAIRLAGRTDGINSTDLFEITAVDDSLDTVTVTPTPGTTTSGVTWAIGGALATIQRSLNVVRPSEKIWVKATGTYTETLTAASTGFGTSSASTEIEGYTSVISPPDGGIVTISGRFAAVAGTYHWIIRNFRVTGSTADGVGFGPSANQIHFRRCRSDSHTGASSEGFAVGAGCTFVHCYAHDNGSSGFLCSGSANASLFVGCIALSNGGHGITAANNAAAYKCVTFSNVLNNYLFTGANTFVFQCVGDGDADDSDIGIAFANGSATQGQCVVDCIVYDCATGISSTTNRGESMVSFNNVLFGNAANYSNWFTEAGEITSAGGGQTIPGFANEASNDYGILSTSVAKSTGFDLQDNPWGLTFTGRRHDIGAMTAPAGGGGGGSSGILTGGKM